MRNDGDHTASHIANVKPVKLPPLHGDRWFGCLPD